MLVSLIVAMERNRGIGKDNQIPWHLPDDLKNFKLLTMGHHIIMGRKTHGSINRSLPGRFSIVITHQTGYTSQNCRPVDCRVTASLEEALLFAETRGESEAFVIGGGSIYTQALPYAHRLYLTLVQTNLPCDIYFPVVNLNDWSEISRVDHPQDDRHAFPFTFLIVEKKPGEE